MLTPEFIQATGITEGQVTELNTFISETKMTPEHESALQAHIINMAADIRNNGANDHAEGILSGAAKRVEELTGIKRDKGQKLADYFVLAGTKHVSDRELKLKEKEAALEEKIKNGNTDETVKKELAETKAKLDALLQKEASIDELIKGDYKTKYEKAQGDIISFKEKTAFAMAKPSFAKEVNVYEAAAVWKDVTDEIRKAYDIEFDENDNAIAVDKTNKFKTAKLTDLIQKNDKIIALVKGRQQNGTGHKKADVTLEGIPFSLPENATSQDVQKAIKEYLLNEKKLSFTSAEYATAFGELNIKIKQQQQKTA
jgi:hypothetical protein